jgi:hypothetical protein
MDIDNLTAYIEDDLKDVHALLTHAGYVPEQLAYALRCPASRGVNGWSYYVSAARLAKLGDAFGRSPRYAFTSLQRELLGEVFGTVPKSELTMFIVGGPQELDRLDELDILRMLEDNMDFARKYVVSADQLLARLSPVFEDLSQRANEHPELSLFAELNRRSGPDTAVTMALAATWGRQLVVPTRLLAPENAADRALTSAIYARVMGRDFSLKGEESGVLFCQKYVPRGCEAVFASNGERTGYELSAFLTRAYRNVTPGMTVGIHGSLSGLDALKGISALEVLRDFMQATGASIQFQSPKSETRALAKLKFAKVATIRDMTMAH